MRKTTIRELKHETSTVLAWVAGGESVEVLRRNVPVAILTPPSRPSKVCCPDFEARLKKIYGSKVLGTAGSDLVSESRGKT